MAAVGAALDAVASSPTMLAGTALAALVALVLVRLLTNSIRGSQPPVFEGVPFIGGLMKFAGVRRLRSQRVQLAAGRVSLAVVGGSLVCDGDRDNTNTGSWMMLPHQHSATSPSTNTAAAARAPGS